MRNYNIILTEKQRKYQRYHLEKLIKMNILEVKKYYLRNQIEEIKKQLYIYIYIYLYIQVDSFIDVQVDRQIDRQIDRYGFEQLDTTRTFGENIYTGKKKYK